MRSPQTLVRLGLLLSLGAASLIALANAAAPDDRIPFGVDTNTVRIEGWFSYRGEGGEPMVNSTKGFDTFNPLNKEESRRCVSLVNATGRDPLDYLGFNDREVVVSGFSIRYQDMPLGNSYVDRVTDHRYYKGQWVQNACLREWVFVATRIELKD